MDIGINKYLNCLKTETKSFEVEGLNIPDHPSSVTLQMALLMFSSYYHLQLPCLVWCCSLVGFKILDGLSVQLERQKHMSATV